MYNKTNVFFKILNNQIAAKKIYEDEYALSFYDINPASAVHALVITKDLCKDYNDFVSSAKPDRVYGFFAAVKKTADILKVSGDGFRIISNIGKNSGQEVHHFHVHIMGGEKLKSF